MLCKTYLNRSSASETKDPRMVFRRKIDPARIGVFMPQWLGDFVMATPALRVIRRHFGSANIVGIMRPYLKEVLSGTDWLDQQWYFDPHRKTPGTGHLAVLQKIKATEFDMMVLLPNSPRSALLAWLGCAKERIGYARYLRGPLLTSKVHSPKIEGRSILLPTVDYYLRLAEATGCPPESQQLELRTTPEEEQSADEVFRHLGLRQDGRIVTLNCSGAYGGAKLWPIEHFAELARRVAAELEHDVLVMCGPAEVQAAKEIVRLAESERVFSMAEQPLGIGTAKACIRRSRLMVSTDSGPRHVAAAVGCAVITVYGPILPVWGRNPTVDATDLYLKDLECIGCGRRNCPRGHHKCMRELSADRVFRAVAAWMNPKAAPEHKIVGLAASAKQPVPTPMLPTVRASAAGKT
jgi:heptosyltransferase-2